MRRYTLPISLTLLIFCFTVTAGYDIIKNPFVAQYTMSRHNALQVFTLNAKYWSTGERITVVLLPWSSFGHHEFVKTKLRIHPLEHRARIEKAINQGNATRYVKVRSEAEMIEKVKLIQGAIGYSSAYAVMSDGDHINIIEVTD